MNSIQTAQPAQQLNSKFIVRLLIGAAFGALVGGGYIKLAIWLRVPVKTFTWADTLALVLGGILACLGLITWLISFNRKELARNLEADGATPASSEEVSAVRLQAGSLFLAGVMLLLPLAAMGSLSGVTAGAAIIFALIVVLFLLQSGVHVVLWRRCDEFQRGQLLKACAVTFAVGQGALFLWAAAEHLHLAPAISSWQCINLLIALYLAVGNYLALRARYS